MAIASVDQFGVFIPQAYDDFGGGNHFRPLFLSEEGIFYSTEAIRHADDGETPDTVLAWNWFFKWDRDSPDDYRNVDNVTWRIDLAGENLDLKGGDVYAFVLVADVVGGQTVPSSGRYWLESHPLTVGTFTSPHANIFTVPSSSGWTCTFSRNGGIPSIPNMPAAPDLRYIECIGVGFKGWSAEPTGKFGVKLFQID